MKIAEHGMFKRIHIFGASGTGASTLGAALARSLPHTHLDGDDYFWIEKFSEAREPGERRVLLKEDLMEKEHTILSGAICGWGDELKHFFDFVVFLYVPQEVRLKRLAEREFARYGNAVLPGGNRYEQSHAFLNWASLYDSAGMEVRSQTLHEHWMSDLQCPILRIKGEHTTSERVAMVLNELSRSKRGDIH